jgi:hypothetical protein
MDTIFYRRGLMDTKIKRCTLYRAGAMILEQHLFRGLVLKGIVFASLTAQVVRKVDGNLDYGVCDSFSQDDKSLRTEMN